MKRSLGRTASRRNMTFSIRLKNPSGQKVTVKKTISDVSPGNSNRLRTKLARKNSRHFSCIFTHLQKQGVLQQNHSQEPTPFGFQRQGRGRGRWCGCTRPATRADRRQISVNSEN